MLILLPPSETKRSGGAEGSSLSLPTLSYRELDRPRRAVIAATRKLARNRGTMAAALGLSATQRIELMRNRQLGSSPVMPALERYTGVLYDALDSETLSPAARAFAHGRVLIHSAMFGLLDADDPIPAYRLSHDSTLPGLSLKSTWRAPITSVLRRGSGLILDLRSEAYAGLGPVPPDVESVYLRLMATGPDAAVRALSHVNKKGKGQFVRALLQASIDHESVEAVMEWANGHGFALRRGDRGELELLV